MNCESKTKYVAGFSQIPADNAAVLNSLIFYQNTKDLTNSQTQCSLIQQGEQRIIMLGAVNPDISMMKRACKNLYTQENDYKRVPSDKNIKL
jgi:hypothetical protein